VKETNGHLIPSRAGRFGEVADLIRSGDPATAFTRAAEVVLERYELLKKEMGAAVVIKLAIDLHRHALFCEVALDKARTQHTEEAYKRYQDYLNGVTDTPVAIGLMPGTAVALAPVADVDVESEGDGDGEDEEGD
jgi:hypothetical protein